MPTSPNEDGRPTQGGAAAPVHVMNPAGSGTQPVSGTVNAIITNGTDAATIQTANADGVSNTQNNLTTTSRIMGFNGVTWDRLRTAVSDALAATGLLALGSMLWNGATWDRLRGITSSNAAIAGTGIVAVGMYGLDANTETTNRLIEVRRAMADANANALSWLLTANANLLYDPTLDTFYRQRGNYEQTVLASAARTASVDSADLVNYNLPGIIVVIDVTALTATGQLTVTLQGKDTLSGKYYTLIASAAIIATGTTILRVYPGSTIAANLVADSAVPRVWRVSIAALNGVSITYSVGVNYVS